MPIPEAIFKPFIFKIDPATLGSEVRVLKYVVPAAAFRKLKEVQGASVNPSLEGLEVLLGWAAPEVDLVEVDRPVGATDRTIVLTVIDPRGPIDALKARVRMGLNAWLSISVGERAGDVAQLLDDGRAARTAWRTDVIRPLFNRTTGIPDPVDPRLFDLLVLRAARLLCDADTGDGIQRPALRLLAAGAAKRLFGGKELVTFPPLQAQRGYWGETVKVFAMTTPEQSAIRIGVRQGVRNYVKVVRAPGYDDPHRTLDIFIPPTTSSGALASMQRWVAARVRLGRFWSPDGSAGVVLQPSKTRDALDLIAHTVGAPGFFQKFDGTPACEANLWVLPRAGTVHGDKYLPAGSGVGMPDRATMLETLTRRLERGGFEPIPPLRVHRVRSRRWSWARPFHHLKLDTDAGNSAEHYRQIRRSVIQSMEAGPDPSALRFAIFWQRIETPDLIRAALAGILGKPDQQSETTLTWNDGLRIELAVHPAEILAMSVDLQVAIADTLSADQRARIDSAARKERRAAAEKSMVPYLQKCLPELSYPTISILEMPDSVRDTAGDPYILAQRAFATHGTPLQVMLWSSESGSVNDEGDEEDRSEISKARSCVLDLLRCLGVSPRSISMEAPKATVEFERLQGWWVVRRNETRPNAKDGFVTPVCVESSGAKLRVALMTVGGELRWMTYASAVCAITLRQAENLAGKSSGELFTTVERFFERCVGDGLPRTVFCESSNLRGVVRGLRNSALNIGVLPLGAAGLTTPIATLRDAGMINLIRVSLEDGRTPSYVIENRSQGIAVGIFSESASTRTFWISRGLPTALQRSLTHRKANVASRHGSHKDASKLSPSARERSDRRLPSLSEICAVTIRADVNPEEVANLARVCMRTHVTSKDELLLPFPLHEAELLSNHVR